MARDPKYQKIHAVILSRKPLKESDYLLTVYSKERGKLKVLARGMRKQNAKLAGRLQQLYNVELYLAGSGIWPTVTSASVIDKYPKLRANLEALSLSFYAAEMVTKLTIDDEENPRIYDLLNRFLLELNRTQKKIDFSNVERTWPPILEKFRLDLLRIIGHAVTVRFCAHCGLKVAPASKVSFSCFGGGVVHAECGRNFPDTKHISDITAGQLALLDQQALEDVGDLVVGEEGHRCISNFVSFLMEREVQSERFLEKIRGE